MTDITVLEIHLHDASFTANAPNSGLGDEESEIAPVDAEGGGPSPLPKLLALVGVALLVVIGRRLVGGEEEPVPV